MKHMLLIAFCVSMTLHDPALAQATPEISDEHVAHDKKRPLQKPRSKAGHKEMVRVSISRIILGRPDTHEQGRHNTAVYKVTLNKQTSSLSNDLQKSLTAMAKSDSGHSKNHFIWGGHRAQQALQDIPGAQESRLHKTSSKKNLSIPQIMALSHGENNDGHDSDDEGANEEDDEDKDEDKEEPETEDTSEDHKDS